MEYIVFQHKSDRRFVLLCDEDYNPIIEEESGQREPRNKALYASFAGGFAGVYSSIEGPVLFVNRSKILFSDPSWSVSVKKNGDTNKVKFSGLNSSVLEFEYPAVKLDAMDPWSEEQFDDFFIWLTNKRHDREFMDVWTE